ncbi:OmpA family protein [Pseudomonas sp. LS44]|uniref:OmpA family protein n=1 Tax=Pseudomonas sp. LS44 TaxID=1357074 RepID=UPI00215B6BF9|nr:OmpA family protein [Pseudomonas sp. LS44]UVE18859.1 OmpA family protein [Pseudomonas sp. LS44]
MKLLKTAAVFICLTATGCSSLNHEPSSSSPSTRSAASSEKSWWPFGGKKTAPETAAKIDEAATHAWLDAYEPRLREALKDSKFTLERRDNVLIVTAPVDSSFNPDRPGMLMPTTLGPFSRVAKLVEGDSKTGVLVLGHADTSGQAPVNRQLSQERAQAVAAIFRLSGLRRDRLLLKGVGSDMPRAANDSREGRALNRRVEIVLTPQHTLMALLAQYNTPAKAGPVLAVTQTK